MSRSALRSLPSVARLLDAPAWDGSAAPAAVRTAACRAVVERVRAALLAGDLSEGAVDPEAMAAEAARVAADTVAPVLRPVVNATGVILHTNLGRAPLPPAAVQAIAGTAGRYTNLEMSLETGRRDHRLVKLSAAFARVVGAPEAVVVNNNAAAVFLVLKALAGDGTGVAVSRGEQVEIGGSFRIPDILAEAGGRMIEVGTTNRTHLRDYEAAMDAGARILLKVHRSNFEVVGFTKEVSPAELVELARRRDGIVVHDLGSGLLWGEFAGEDSVRGMLDAGVDVVCFSGDKLLGGPQCGIVVGRADLVQRIRRHPLMRMLRPGKLQLLALEATLLAWERDPAGGEIPAARAIARSPRELKAAATDLRRRLAPLLPASVTARVVDVESTPGGGSAPSVTLPSSAVALEGAGLATLAARLRAGRPALVGRLEGDRLLLDVRTLLPGDDDAVVDAFAALGALSPSGSAG